MSRHPFHDYRAKCIYHIIMNKRRGVDDFGTLARLPGGWQVRRSALGQIVASEIYNLPRYEPALQVMQYAIMPDHVHFLLFVKGVTRYHLGQYVSRLKVKVGRRALETGVPAAQIPVFEEDFYDCILWEHRDLDTIFRYIRDNPRRLGDRHEHPEWFCRVNSLTLGGSLCRAYGNIALLENPFKEAVQVHRADTGAEFEAKLARWLHTAANRGVLVSPFISEREKIVRHQAEALGSKLIVITNRPLYDWFKPSEHDFNLCRRGLLLIVAMECPGGGVSRSACMAMNKLAAEIACR